MSKIVGIYGCWDERDTGRPIKGNGKTLTAIYYLYNKYKAGQVCYSNTPTNFAEDMSTHQAYEIFKSPEVKRIAILLDEIQKDINSIGSNLKFVVDFCNKAAAQTRKKGVDMFWTAQRAWDVHKRLRVQTDVFLQTVKIHRDYTLCDKEPFDEELNPYGCKREHFIAVFDRTGNRFSNKPIVYLDCASVGTLYDTNHVIMDSMERDE